MPRMVSSEELRFLKMLFRKTREYRQGQDLKLKRFAAVLQMYDSTGWRRVQLRPPWRAETWRTHVRRGRTASHDVRGLSRTCLFLPVLVPHRRMLREGIDDITIHYTTTERGREAAKRAGYASGIRTRAMPLGVS